MESLQSAAVFWPPVVGNREPLKVSEQCGGGSLGVDGFGKKEATERPDWSSQLSRWSRPGPVFMHWARTDRAWQLLERGSPEEPREGVSFLEPEKEGGGGREMKDNGRVRGEGEDLRSKRPHFGGAVRTPRGAVGPQLRFGSRVQRRVRVRERAEQEGAPRCDDYVQYSFFLLSHVSGGRCENSLWHLSCQHCFLPDGDGDSDGLAASAEQDKRGLRGTPHYLQLLLLSSVVWFPLFLINIC